MSPRFIAALAAALLACAAGAWAALPSAARGGTSCASHGYTYAGLAQNDAAHGVTATVTAVSAPRVSGGHVAAWVGVGGRGLGPGGTNAWLQAGLATYRGGGSRLYYELMLPAGRRYVELARGVRPGTRFTVAVLEVAPGTWHVVVNGRAVSPAFALPVSSSGLPAIVTAESWATTTQACNQYAFGFAGAQFIGADGLSHAFSKPQIIVSSSTQITRRSETGFLATS
ncbi:MAG: hypothetical protein ABI948_01515 [Thermoleophilia bacterium]